MDYFTICLTSLTFISLLKIIISNDFVLYDIITEMKYYKVLSYHVLLFVCLSFMTILIHVSLISAVGPPNLISWPMITNISACDQLLIPHDSRISCENQITIRLRDHLSRRNNSSTEDRTSDVYITNPMHLILYLLSQPWGQIYVKEILFRIGFITDSHADLWLLLICIYNLKYNYYDFLFQF